MIAKDCSPIDFATLSSHAKLLSFPRDKNSKERTKEENEQIAQACYNAQFDTLIFTPNRAPILPFLHSLPPQDMLIVEDITLLPFACSYKATHKHCQILIDLREFYPLEYENDEQWLRTLGRLFAHLCDCYLPKVDIALSVSEGLCAQYKKDFHLPCTLFYSLPPFFDYTPTPTNAQEIKILYHGFISPDRSSMELLDLARLLINSPYKLYVMALSNQKGFLESFCAKASSLPSIEILKPVNLAEIIPTSAQYDIGLIPFKPSTFNLVHCMPNKLFEYIQSRLALLCTPLVDVSAFVKTHQCGAIASGFESEDILHTLLSLESKDIDTLKSYSHKAAQKWHIGHNQHILEHLLCNHLGIRIE